MERVEETGSGRVGSPFETVHERRMHERRWLNWYGNKGMAERAALFFLGGKRGKINKKKYAKTISRSFTCVKGLLSDAKEEIKERGCES